MEEVDSIIVRQLRAIECEIDDQKTSLKELDLNEMINSASRCLFLIKRSSQGADFESSDQYFTIDSNSNMATKYKIANDLSSQINSLGYRTGYQSARKDGSNLGYQTFLYGSHSEFRNMFLFLISKLPKDNTGTDVTMTRSFDQDLKDKIRRHLSINDIWLPFMTDDEDQSVAGQFDKCGKLSHKLWNQQWREYLSKDENVAHVYRRTVIDENLKQEASHGNSPSGTEAELELLEKELKLVEDSLREKQATITSKKVSLDESLKVLKGEQLELIELKHSDRSVESLIGAVSVLNQDLDTIKEKWVELEIGLVGEKEFAIAELKSKSSESDQLMEQLSNIKSQVINNANEMTEKQALLESLQQSIPSKSVPTRKSYTKRILEIINNYKKQMDQTKKILIEIKGHQKEINLLSGKVSRSFAICDDTIFNSGEKLERIDPEFYRKSYKLLANLHDMNSTILTGLESIGSIKRDILKTEQLIEKEESERIDEKLDKITKDLASIKSLNHQLNSKVDQ